MFRPWNYAPSMTPGELEEFGRSVSIPVREERMGDQDCFSLNEIATCTYILMRCDHRASHELMNHAHTSLKPTL